MQSESSSDIADGALIRKTAEAVLGSERTVALTGAGISVGSGIPPFRGTGGLWEKYNPDEYAHIESFKRNPKKVWIMLSEMIDTIRVAKPNAAHFSLAKLEEMGLLEGIITGNVDFLHQAAGSKNVFELHGNNRSLICMKCQKSYPVERYLENMPPRCDCGYPLRPDVVLFGEQLPEKALSGSYALARACDLMLVVGTSAVVSPMSHMPIVAKESGAKVLEINLERTFLSDFLSDWIIMGVAEDILPKIVEDVKSQKSSY
jgi:NAD-dependent deacetylase